jgi:hypothetical protein
MTMDSMHVTPFHDDFHPRTDRERLIRIETIVASIKEDINDNDNVIDLRIKNLHDRIVPVEKYIDLLVNKEIIKKVEEHDRLVNEIKWSYRTISVISAGVGGLIVFLLNVI